MGREHMGLVFLIQFSSDGTKLASAGTHDTPADIWDAGRIGFGPRTSGIKSDIKALIFWPDITRLALGFEEPHILLMDVEKGNIILVLPVSKTTKIRSPPSHFHLMGNGLHLALTTEPSKFGTWRHGARSSI